MSSGRERLFIAFYTDEDITDRLPSLLRERGFEATSVLEEGTIGLSDEEQLTYAAREFSPLTRSTVPYRGGLRLLSVLAG
jgi:hypothetical protein